MQQKTLLTGCRVATMVEGGGPYGLIEDGTVAIEGEHIAWVGSRDRLPDEYSAYEVEELDGRLVTPALIDCHTHLLFGGNRAREFEMRLNGASYEEIARSGGGIVSTVSATRMASDEELIAGALKRLDDLISEGVAVVEIKSGYGLTIEQEMRMLRLARHLQALRPVKIVTTWLAAHALPPEYRDRPDAYVDEVAIAGMRHAAAEGLVDAVDGFCETIGFTPEQIARVFDAAKEIGLPIKLHAEQLSDLKGALMVGEYGGLSADHLEYLAESDVPAFAQSGVVAVILPGAFYTLRETKLPPINALRTNNVPMAVATDCNPGSSPLSSILTAMNMASTQFAMTPEEVLAGVTRNAAQALGLAGEYGTISAAARAELAVWEAEHPSELSYWIGGSPLFKRISAELN